MTLLAVLVAIAIGRGYSRALRRTRDWREIADDLAFWGQANEIQPTPEPFRLEWSRALTRYEEARRRGR